jgi:hypothetical protein
MEVEAGMKGPMVRVPLIVYLEIVVKVPDSGCLMLDKSGPGNVNYGLGG